MIMFLSKNESDQRLGFIDRCCATLYSVSVIESFKHRGLKRCVEQDDSRRLPRDMVERIKYILTQLHAAEDIGDMDLHSFNLHELKGNRKGTWSVIVRANWRITFRFTKGHALDVDFEDYH